MAGVFEVFVDDRGMHRFRLRTSDGTVVAVGEPCESKAHVLSGIAAVMTSVAGATVTEVDLPVGSVPSHDLGPPRLKG